MENTEEIEAKFLELVQQQFVKSGYANGIDLYHINLVLQIDGVLLKQIKDKLLKDRKIVQVNHLNGTSYTLPK